MRQLAAFFAVLVFAAPLLAQRVDSTATHFRVFALDRVVVDENGNKLPLHAKGKLAFNAIYGPQDMQCLVEYVALRNDDLNDVRRDRDKDKAKDDKDKTKIRVWEKAHTKRSDFIAAARAAGFVNVNLGNFFVGVR